MIDNNFFSEKATAKYDGLLWYVILVLTTEGKLDESANKFDMLLSNQKDCAVRAKSEAFDDKRSSDIFPSEDEVLK